MGGSKGCLVKLLLMVKEPRAAPYSLVAAACGTTRHHSPPPAAEWQPPAPASRHQHNNLAGLPLCEKVVMKNAPSFAISRQIDSFNIKLHIAHGRGILAEYFQPLIFGF